MKLLIVAIAFCLVLASCSGPFGSNAEGYDVLHDDLDTAWIATAALEYQPDPPGGYWKSPHETEHDGGGDCEDLATYLVYRLGEDARLIGIKRPSGAGHCIVKYAGRYLKPQAHNVFYNAADLVITLDLSYSTTMFYATHQGSKQL